jgi:hypothetical protein
MSPADSALDPELIARARRLLAPPFTRVRMWPVVAAATFAAISALSLAAAMIVAPPVSTSHITRDIGGQDEGP